MRIDCGDNDKSTKIGLNKKLQGCPRCHSSRYVVLTKNIKDKSYRYREIYCHFCDIVFSPIHAVTPIEINEQWS
jgi:hypothetical protein